MGENEAVDIAVLKTKQEETNRRIETVEKTVQKLIWSSLFAAVSGFGTLAFALFDHFLRSAH